MIKKSILCLIVFISALNTIFAQASEQNLSVETDGNILTVKITSDISEGAVGVYLFRGDGFQAELSEIDEAQLSENITDFGLLELSESDSLEMTLSQDTKSGRYTVYAVSENFFEDIVYSFDYISPQDVEELFSKINDSQSKEAVKSIIEKYSDLLPYFGQSKQTIENMDSDQMLLMADAVFNNGVDYTGENKKEQLSDNIKKGIAVSGIDSSSDCYTQISEILSITDFAYKEGYQALTESGRVIFNRSVKKYIPFDSYAAFEEALLKSYITSDVMSGAYTAVYNKLSTYKAAHPEIISIDFTLYNSSGTDKTAALKALMTKTVSGTEELCKTFESCVQNNQYKISAGGTGGSSGGSGSSGGTRSSGSGIFIQPVSATSSDEISEPEDSADEFAFLDLDTCPWAEESIRALWEMGVVNGRSKEQFDPDAEVKREEFIKMLSIALNFDGGGETQTFTDIPGDSIFLPYIESAAKSGVTEGMDNGIWGYGQMITRQDMVVMCYRAVNIKGAKLPAYASDMHFSDSNQISDYAREAIAAMTSAELVTGTEKGFEPHEFTTRAQAACLIHRMVQLINS